MLLSSVFSTGVPVTGTSQKLSTTNPPAAEINAKKTRVTMSLDIFSISSFSLRELFATHEAYYYTPGPVGKEPIHDILIVFSDNRRFVNGYIP